ncbi:MAG: hypothetical protein WD941_08855 [Opitutus sp.]
MANIINRRTFLNRAARGAGSVALGSALSPFVQISLAQSTPPRTGGRKRLLATTDYTGNYSSDGFYDRAMLDDLHGYLASIGVTRHQMIVDIDRDLDLYHEHQPPGFDLYSEAVASAHAHGLEFYAQIKLNEGGGRELLPNTLPFPADPIAVRDLRGIFARASPFVARNPQMCMRRRPGTFEVRGPVSSIRLVKSDDQPTRIREGHLSIWTSPTNNRYSRYEGPVSFRESIEWRSGFRFGGTGERSESRLHRILHLDGLRLPGDHRYFLIRCSLAGEQADFTNERGSLVELSGPNQENIPHILGTGAGRYNRDAFQSPTARLQRYYQHPDVQAELLSPERAAEHYRDYHAFGETRITRPYTLDREGHVAIALGKPEYLLGVLHPIYPEVREYWLDRVRYCLDRGVDGIHFRHSCHVQSAEYWEYGFNDPVIVAAGGRTDHPSIQHVNGEAYTRFLREARNLIKSRGKSITIELYAQMLMPDDRPQALPFHPPNILNTHWKTWVDEIADDLELRGVWTLRPWNLRKVTDTFSAATRAAGKPFHFQGNLHELGAAERGSDSVDGESHHLTREELGMVREHPGIDGFVLYETNVFTRKNAAGRIEGSTALKKLIQTHWF